MVALGNDYYQLMVFYAEFKLLQYINQVFLVLVTQVTNS